jgi:DNA uptake protein ComE-like DNA-binding protein
MMKILKLQPPNSGETSGSQSGSTFILVLWIAFGLVSIALYFGHSMSMELRASDNRVSGVQAEQAIEGAARYVAYILANQLTNGVVPDPSLHLSEAASVGESHFWLIGRDTNSSSSPSGLGGINGPGQLTFGLVDEASKLNLNSASSNMLAALVEELPRANQDLATAILDWRDTNSGGTYQAYYGSRPQPYQCKKGPFETVDELRLLYGADMETLVGEDLNRNGVLDPNEDANHNGQFEPGVLEYVTVYSREPNTYSNGLPRVSLRGVTATGPLATLLQSGFGATRAEQILINLGVLTAAATGGGRIPRVAPPAIFASPLQFYVRSRMTADEFAQIADDLTVTTNATIDGRVNINTASATVLACLPGINSNPSLAQTLVSFRQSNPDKLGSVAWIVDALGQNSSDVLTALQATDCITTRSYQFTADVAALGPHGRGYRRVRFVFDTTEGTPKIIYRQDLTHLGWALGNDVRQTWLLAKATR